MARRSFYSYDNDSMLIDGDPSTPIINNSDTPNGTVFSFSGGGGREITLRDRGGKGTSKDIFEDDEEARHTIIDGGGLVSDGTQVEAESHILVRALDDNGNPVGPTITLTVFSQDGQTQNVWGFAADGPLSPGTSYVKTGGNNTGDSAYSSFVPCFVRGTRIRTARGDVAVEELRAGDMVWTAGAGDKPVRWVGESRVAADGALAPIVFKAGAIGNETELSTSPNHRMLIEGWQVDLLFGEDAVLVPAKHLAGLPGISAQPAPMVDYFHILFDRHEIVEANGVLSESFYPGPTALNGIGRETRAELLQIFPGLDVAAEGYGDTALRCLTGGEAGVLRDAMRAA